MLSKLYIDNMVKKLKMLISKGITYDGNIKYFLG